MTDELAGLDAKLLRGMLPGLYKQAQEGDGAAQGRVLKIVEMLGRLEPARGLDTAQTPTRPTGTGFTAPAGAPGQAESRLSKQGLGVWLGERQRLGHGPPAWLELYDDLLEERAPDGKLRWDWRKALFIAWSSVPRGQREPKTLSELANMLGVRPSTMRKWRLHDAEIVSRISETPRRLLLEHVADVYQALVDVATMADPRAFQDRRLFLEMTGDYRPSAALALDGRMDLEHGGQVDVVHDLSRLSEEQLRELAAIAEALGVAG